MSEIVGRCINCGQSLTVDHRCARPSLGWNVLFPDEQAAERQRQEAEAFRWMASHPYRAAEMLRLYHAMTDDLFAAILSARSEVRG